METTCTADNIKRRAGSNRGKYSARIPRDVYARARLVAKAYRLLLKRRAEAAINERNDRKGEINTPNACCENCDTHSKTEPEASANPEDWAREAARLAELDRKIYAVESALGEYDGYDRSFIEENLFDGKPDTRIDVPLSEIGKRRLRKSFIYDLAGFLDEI